MHVIVDVTRTNQQFTLEVFGQVGIFVDVVLKSDVAFSVLDFLDAIVFLAPPAIVDVVLVVAGGRHCYFEKIGVHQHGRRRHESTTGVPKNTHLIDVDVGMAIRQLLGGYFFVFQSVVAQVAVAVIVVPFRTTRMPAAVADGDDDEAQLRLPVGAIHAHREGLVDRFGLRPRVYVLDDGIFEGRVKIKRFVHHAVEVGNAICSFDYKRLGELVACGKKLR